MTDKVGAAVGALVFNQFGQILLCRRKDGSGSYNPPCGRIEPGEEPSDAIAREILEETGVQCKAASQIGALTHDSPDPRMGHWVTIWYVAELVDYDVRQAEPDKLEPWEWFDLDALPTPLFGSTEKIIDWAAQMLKLAEEYGNLDNDTAGSPPS